MNILDVATGVVEDGLLASDIRVEDNLADFAINRNLTIDGRPFDLKRYPYLEPIYRECFKVENIMKPEFRAVLMFGAQTGKTVLMSLAMAWMSLLFRTSSWGYYFPVQTLAQLFSTERFYPMMASNAALKVLTESDDYFDRKQSTIVRHIGLSSVYFLWTSGRVTTESFPFWGVIFDEVRRMPPGDIERANERISASPHKIRIMASTAGFPDTDIDGYFQDSCMNRWHVRCDCPEGVVLENHWPEIIHESRSGKLRYRCPDCEANLDPADGQYRAERPGHPTYGFNIPQLISPNVTIEEISEKWQKTRDRKEFYNSTLGRPYVALDTQPINDAVWNRCIVDDLKWGRIVEPTYMGVDQRGLENHVIILHRDGRRFRLVDVEIIQTDDPFLRLYQLMKEYRIAHCVVDANPNYNEAVRFAKAHPERVHIATYHEVREGIRWMDKSHTPESQRKTKLEDQFLWSVRIDRYKSIDGMMQIFSRQEIDIPPPRDKVQTIRVDGQETPVMVALGDRDQHHPGLLLHLKSVARVRVPIFTKGPDGEPIDTGKERMDWQNLGGIDPHWLHALNYAVIASERRSSLGELILSGETVETKDQPQAVRSQIVSTSVTAPQIDTTKQCHECYFFSTKPKPGKPNCSYANQNTKPNAPICEGFRPQDIEPKGEDDGGYFIV